MGVLSQADDTAWRKWLVAGTARCGDFQHRTVAEPQLVDDASA